MGRLRVEADESTLWGRLGNNKEIRIKLRKEEKEQARCRRRVFGTGEMTSGEVTVESGCVAASLEP